MSRQSHANSDGSRLKVSHFAHHDHIGVMPQDASQPPREIKSDFRHNLHLCNPLHFIFHGILDGDNFTFSCVNAIQTGIKSGCFSASSGAREKYNAVGFLYQAFKDS